MSRKEGELTEVIMEAAISPSGEQDLLIQCFQQVDECLSPTSVKARMARERGVKGKEVGCIVLHKRVCGFSLKKRRMRGMSKLTQTGD